MESKPNQISKAATIIESAGKVIVGITGISFLSGIIITNLYLLKWGIVDFTIVKTKYMLTGAVFLIAHGFLYVLFLVVLQPFVAFLTSHRRITLRRLANGLILTVVVVISALVVTWILAVGLLNKNFSPFSQLIVIEWFSLWPFLALYPTLIVSHLIFSTGFHLLVPKPVLVFVLSVAWLVNLMLFSEEIYPKVNPQFGGGRPLKAAFLLQNEILAVLPAGLRHTDNANVAEWTLIHERSEEYIVAAFNDVSRHLNIITLPKSQTAGFILDEEHLYERAVEDAKDGAVFSAKTETWDIILRTHDAGISIRDISKLTQLLENDIYNFLLIKNRLELAVESGERLPSVVEELVKTNDDWSSAVHYILSYILADKAPMGGRDH